MNYAKRIEKAAAKDAQRRSCQTCGAAIAPYTCAWKCEQPRFTLPIELSVGDVIVKLKRHWTVTALVPTDYGIRVEATERNPAGRRAAQELRSFSTRWRVLRRAVCGERACEAHVREVADGVHYCRAHWDSWKEQAS